jgi:hypothetical protein
MKVVVLWKLYFMRTNNKWLRSEEIVEKFPDKEILSEPETDFGIEGDDEIIDNLSLEQSRRLRESIKQAREGKTVSHEEAMKVFKE